MSMRASINDFTFEDCLDDDDGSDEIERAAVSFRNMNIFSGAFQRQATTHASEEKPHGFIRSIYNGLDADVADCPAVFWANAYFGFRIMSVRELRTAIPYLYV